MKRQHITFHEASKEFGISTAYLRKLYYDKRIKAEEVATGPSRFVFMIHRPALKAFLNRPPAKTGRPPQKRA